MIILDFPFQTKEIRNLQAPGVYMFFELTALEAKTQLAPGAMNFAVLKSLKPLYIGKAKCLRNRLACYVTKAPGSEWEKKQLLQSAARCVVVFPAQSHLEACIKEIAGIRSLNPRLNRQMKRISALHFLFVHKGALYLRSKLSAPGICLGFFSSRRDAEHLLGIFASVVRSLQTQVPLLPLRPVSIPRKAGLQYLTESADPQSDASLRAAFRLFLKGKKAPFQEHIWEEMKKAAQEMRFQHAAAYRDIYLSLRSLQKSLFRSRQLLKRYRNCSFQVQSQSVPSALKIQSSEFQMTFEEIHSNETTAGDLLMEVLHFPLRQALSQASTERCQLTATLRINYEIIRLMHHWYARQIEPCQWEKGLAAPTLKKLGPSAFLNPPHPQEPNKETMPSKS